MSFLTHPSIAGLSVGSSEWFEAQRRMIQMKPAVLRCYNLWYALLLEEVASVEAEGAVVELGSGSSFLKELLPEVITSDVVPASVDLVIDARRLPFPSCSIKALLLTHVFHHIPDVRLFLREAERVLVPGGVVAMIDCAHTPLSRLFFRRFHPEPYDHEAEDWDFPAGHTMLNSNQALSWVVFERDQKLFEAEFPGLAYEGFEYLPWCSYLLSGGVNLRSLVPQCAGGLAAALDRVLRPLDRLGAIHWRLTIRKRENTQQHTRRHALVREAQYLFQAFFGMHAEPKLTLHYAEAHEKLDVAESAEEQDLMRRLREEGLDAEALEYAWRLRDRGNLLTRKAAILHYLAEGSPRMADDFLPGAASNRLAWAEVAGIAASALFRLAKGKRLLRRLGLE